jgi:hypothetical protein
MPHATGPLIVVGPPQTFLGKKKYDSSSDFSKHNAWKNQDLSFFIQKNVFQPLLT